MVVTVRYSLSVTIQSTRLQSRIHNKVYLAKTPFEVSNIPITVAFGLNERRYLVNISLHRGSALICAVQIFSHPDWLKMGGR